MRPRTVCLAIATGMVCSSLLVAQGCRLAPMSGRRQLVLIPESQEIALGEQAYKETVSTQPMSSDAEITAMVERVGRRIAAVAAKPEYEWEFGVIAENVQNAFALPGGKVAVYEGILPVCQSEAGLAVVMSHEIAHAIARHGGERMSQLSVVGGVGSIINAVSENHADTATTQRIMQVYGVTSQYGVVLPFSRKHESEADAIGLILMAKAGYDPSVAPEFWERFAEASGPKAPEWLSTHPADASRAADLRALLPEAMKYYESAQEQYGMGEEIPVSRLAATPTGDAESNVQQTAGMQTYAPVSALTSRHSAKRGEVTHATHEVPSEFAGTNVDESTFPEDALKHAGANFQLPVHTDEKDLTEPTYSDGWSAVENSNPFAAE